MSIPIKNNNANNILCCLKEFVNYVGKPAIFQSDNGSEYKNNIIKNYLDDNNIKRIFSSPRHPQTNGVVEVVHKEVRKNLLCNINDIIDDISFKNIILECVSIHNNNIHTVTGFKPSFLIKNDDHEIYEVVISNIKNKYDICEKDDDKNYIIKVGDHLITKGAPYKLGKTLKIKKTKFKTSKLPTTVLKNFNCGMIKINVDADLYNFKLGDTLFVDPKDTKLISESEWNNVVDAIKKEEEDYRKKLDALNQAKKKIKKLKNLEKVKIIFLLMKILYKMILYWFN